VPLLFFVSSQRNTFPCMCYNFFLRMPYHPEQGRGIEQQLPSYHLAARFREDSVSQTIYNQAQQIIHATDCDLSAYRFLRPSQVAKEPLWYVVVLGEVPPEPLQQQFEAVLKSGERVTLPPEALVPLYQRRLQEIQKGSYVEAHHPIAMRRKQDKDKRKMQNKSRRRNRGK
jgi:hypothetical protein